MLYTSFMMIAVILNLIFLNWNHFFKRKLYFNRYKGRCYFDSYWFGVGNKCINLNELYIRKSINEGYVCGFKPTFSDDGLLATEFFYGGYKNLEKYIPIILSKKEQKLFVKKFSSIEIKGILYKTFFEENSVHYLKLDVM